MQHLRIVLIPVLLAALAITGTSSLANTQPGPELGTLAVYWLDSTGQQDHPDASGNLWQAQYCTGTLPFLVYIHADTDHSNIDDWEADIRVHRGVSGNVSHSFRNRAGTNGVKEMVGRLTLDGDMSLSLRIRGKANSLWGPWSKSAGLYCITTPAVATMVTDVPDNPFNEGDTHTLRVDFDKPMQLDTPLNLRLLRAHGQYPKFAGFPDDGLKTIIVPQGQSTVRVDLRSIDDDIIGNDFDDDLEEIHFDLMTGVGYELRGTTSLDFKIPRRLLRQREHQLCHMG